MCTITMLKSEAAPDFLRREAADFLAVDAEGQVHRGEHGPALPRAHGRPRPAAIAYDRPQPGVTGRAAHGRRQACREAAPREWGSRR